MHTFTLQYLHLDSAIRHAVLNGITAADVHAVQTQFDGSHINNVLAMNEADD